MVKLQHLQFNGIKVNEWSKKALLHKFHKCLQLQSYKDADQRRILKSRDCMVEYAKIDMKVKPLIQKCLEEMEKAGNSVDAEQVSGKFDRVAIYL